MNINEKFKLLLQLYRIPQYFCGVEVLDSNYHYSIRTFLCGITCIMYYLCAVNTIITWPLTSTLELLSACGTAITVS
jgi:hypothetical protein